MYGDDASIVLSKHQPFSLHTCFSVMGLLVIESDEVCIFFLKIKNIFFVGEVKGRLEKGEPQKIFRLLHPSTIEIPSRSPHRFALTSPTFHSMYRHLKSLREFIHLRTATHSVKVLVLVSLSTPPASTPSRRRPNSRGGRCYTTVLL